MSYWRVFLGVIGAVWMSFGHCNGLWLIEQDFVKFGKKDAYEAFKKNQERDFAERVGFSRFALEDEESSQYIYLIPVHDYSGLSSLMEKRLNYHRMLAGREKQQIIPFLSTVKFFMESVHRMLPDCSFVPGGMESMLSYPAAYYYVYGVIPGNGPIFEDRLRKIVAEQKTSANPVCFRAWRVIFGGDVPSYVVAVFGTTPKEAKNLAEGLQIIDGQMKNLLRQEKKGSGIWRRDLSSMMQ